MGRGFDETGTKGVLIAELDETVFLRFLPLDTPRFFTCRVDVMDDPVGAVESVLPPGGSRDHFRVRLTGEVSDGAMVRLHGKFLDYPNLTILDETTPLGNIWDRVDDDTLEGLFFRTLRDGALEADPDTAQTLELAARIGRKLLEGREVVLP
jgi:hypothetical protein